MERELTCIGCPMGCQITVHLDDSGSFLSSEGFTCKIGERYAKEEVTAPTRMVTALMKVEGSDMPLSVKTDHPIAKELIFDCLAEIAKTTVHAPLRIGEIVLPNVCKTDVNIIAARNI